MTSCKYLARYQTESLKEMKSEIHSAIKQNRYAAPAPFQITSHGFCAPDEGIEILENTSFLCANYRYSERSVPSQLVKAYTREKIETIKSMGQAIGKELLREVEADVRQELVLSTPPSVTDLLIVFNYSVNEIWILCAGIAQSDKLSKRLFADLKTLPASLRTLKSEWTQSHLRELINSPDQRFQLHPNYEHLASTGSGSNTSVDRIGGCWDGKIDFTLTRCGEVIKIKTTDEFKSEWYEEGDPGTPELLESISVELWINSVTDLTGYLVQIRSLPIAAEFAQPA